MVCNLGTSLFLNKLSYLTHLTNAESITDREVQILLGEQPSIDGLYFSNSPTIKIAARNSTAIQSGISYSTAVDSRG